MATLVGKPAPKFKSAAIVKGAIKGEVSLDEAGEAAPVVPEVSGELVGVEEGRVEVAAEGVDVALLPVLDQVVGHETIATCA